MKIVGLITEYNPFHKGHEYHIQKAKEMTGADACVVIMSGNYVQRGTPAFMDKHTRTHIALKHGADVVFELPIPFSCASAEYFATAAVTLLHKMGCIDYICFGSECSDINTLKNIADILVDAKCDSTHPINELIKEQLKSGISYAVARSIALSEFLDVEQASTLDMPNNILAIEYLKALKLLGSSIEPVAILRTVASYHDNEANNKLYSASSLRAMIANSDINMISDQLTELYDFDSIYGYILGKLAPITEDDFSNITGEKLLELCLKSVSYNDADCLCNYMGIDLDLAHRMTNSDILYRYTSYTNYINAIKTKNIAYTSISRALLALTLGIKKVDVNAYLDNGIASYVRLLGFRREASVVLNEIKKKGELTIIGQLSEINDNSELSSLDKKMLEHSIYCDELYNMVVRTKFKSDVPSEYSRKIIVH